MPKPTIFEVCPAQGGWLVRTVTEGGEAEVSRPTELFDRKTDAIARAQELMKGRTNARARVVGESGEIEIQYEHRGGSVATR